MASPSSGLTVAVGISVLAFSFVSAIIVVAIYCLKRRFSHRSEPIGFISLEQVAWKKEANSIDVPTQARPFQLLEIKVATESFSRKLGEGGFGPVYHGILPDSHEIAVKVQSYDSKQGANEFFNEVQLLSRAHHRHVVSLVGYCHEANSRMLVYEYLSGGTLERNLHDISSKTLFSWKTRLKIALDAAKGIEYLHCGCNPPIIHRDLKSGNILLTSAMQAKVADFGLSKLVEGSRIFTAVKGTSGYVDPEYYETQELTQKSDVYSFGVVLLEIISGREALIDTPKPRKQLKLSDWARGFLLERRIHKIIDPIFDAVYNIESIWKTAELAMFCVEPRAVHRPAMPEVVQELKQALDIEEGRITVATIEAATPLAPVQAAKHHHARSEPVYYHQNTRNFSFGTSEDESYSFSNLREVKTTEGETTT
ncbi:probable LRR receptor-like protein kinase At1g51890 [Selaginella moellendorffii]|uniref:probable LRR receptor-like protein kinase At1g51890 n=1 Tax=Selaginella moellendorffii TaxID=88036 RepID=UPI000D1CB077|nr:probable LRR receptor-like protein kinase At1g51890 [Selaginella moellendorffii]|eukprot:XP_002963451.2 probable LRR receptor-like protein kinase At1g51890 [Selaginella moellendorffii]